MSFFSSISLSRTGRLLVAGVVCLLALSQLSACHDVDDKRIPWAPVNIQFTTVGVWNSYGVGGALDHRRFIKSEMVPSNFPYTVNSFTGFGGVLLVCDYDNIPKAFDLACPVERKATTRIFVDAADNVGVCPVCGSTYDVFRLGSPLSGPAAQYGYGLTRYNVSSSPSAYKVISN